MSVPTIRWVGDLPGHVEMIDQTLLPGECKVIELHTAEQMWEAIQMLRIRGAPAIGVGAAFGLLLGAQEARATGAGELRERVREISAHLSNARPTAVNLSWALDRMERRLEREKGQGVTELLEALLDEARAILAEDEAICRRIGQHGARVIEPGSGVLTHCNAGGLATSAYGTALAVMFAAHESGTRFHVFADETRPLLQGSRLTSWELKQAGIDVTLICDSMAGLVMREGKVKVVVVGADRIAANGDTANKIGTYSVAVLARAHGIPFYVAAPTSTFDLATATGEGIPIEQRAADEITRLHGTDTAPRDTKVYNPAFDVTPHPMIAGIITEFGILERPDPERVAAFFREHGAAALRRGAG